MVQRQDPVNESQGEIRTKQKNSRSWWKNHRVFITIAILIIIIGGATATVLLTLKITPDQPASEDTNYPYSTTYRASLPDGEQVWVGTLDLVALQTADRIVLRIGDHREEMEPGETRQIGAKIFSIRIAGVPVFETGYQLNATWMGMEGDRALFNIVFRTTRQVPDWLMSRILPAAIEATPA